jgi:gamma-glutamyltranspeptidase/glutathione hydrolase
VSAGQARAARRGYVSLAPQPGFAEAFLAAGEPPAEGALLRQPRLAATLKHLGERGLDDLYRGELARSVAADLASAGSPLAPADLAAYEARRVMPLSLRLRAATLYNLPPPTQGAASLAILGLFERLGGPAVPCDGPDHLHLLVEATKLTFRWRDRWLGDPRDMEADPEDLLRPASLDALAAAVDPARAAPWNGGGHPGDTTWFGAIDAAGRAVSAIQSLYHEFGSGLVLPGSGICWHNRGCVFSLEGRGPRRLRPGRRPFHTLNPAMARLGDGRLLVYGAMGGDGQPQTQAAVFTRHVHFGRPLQEAVTAPRWVLGRTWGPLSATLKLESGFPAALGDALARRGHAVEWVGALDETTGHAGALVRRPDGVLEGATDPRADGCVAAL